MVGEMETLRREGLKQFQLMVDTQVLDDGRLGELVRRWLEEGARELVPEVWAGLQDSLPLTDEMLRREIPRDHPYGPPHGVWARLAVIPRPGRGRSWIRVYSEGNWRRFVQRLDRRPLAAEIALQELDQQGVPYSGELSVQVKSLEDYPTWVQLKVSSLVRSEEGELRRPEVAQRWIDFLHRRVSEVSPSFGCINDDLVAKKTMLDSAVRRGGAVKSIVQGREVLRGYSWVTVCPAELVSRLGGIAALAESGAFARVEELPDGAALLQASDDFSGYDEDTMRRVFTTLAPVLPAGVPRRGPFYDGPWRLVEEDAANYRE